MRIVERLRTGKYLKTLRARDTVAPAKVAEAKSALAALGPAAIPPLLDALESRELRPAAADVLERLLTPETVDTFVDALANGPRRAQPVIAEILTRGRGYDPTALLGALERADVPKARIESILAERVSELPSRPLVDALPGLEREARTIVFRLVDRMHDPTMVPALIKQTEDADWWVRVHAAKLLCRYPGDAEERALAKLLQDENKTVRAQAVKSLREIGSSSQLEPLVNVLRDGDLSVQAAAIDALIAIGDAAAVGFLVDVLKDESEHARRGAVEVLNEVATVSAVQDLVHSLRDADWWVRVRSADALGTIGGPKVVEAILTLVQDEDVHIRRYAIEILNTIPDGRAVETLISALHDEDWWVRERSIDALAETSDRRAVAPLVELLGEEVAVATLAARALETLGFEEALEGLFPLLGRPEDDELGQAVREAVLSIGRNGTEETRDRVRQAFDELGLAFEKTKLRPMEVRGRDGVRSGPAKPAPGPAPSTPPAGSPPAAAPSEELTPEAIQPGMTLLDRYEVQRRIGSGGFSTVFLVRDRAVDETLILKILSSHFTMDENMHQRFVHELRVARKISHPSVIRIHDFLEIGQARGISMEYFESSDLAMILDASKKLAPRRTLRLCRQIAGGLSAAHDSEVIHRDIKPANILVNREDVVKIVDFGLAAAQRQAENRLTRTGHLVGTPHYMAPELIRGEDIGPRSDLYSFGILMYEMVTGHVPYDGDNPMNVLLRHLDGDAKPPKELEPSIPAPLNDLIMRVISMDPFDRPESAAALARLLEEMEI